ncbi:MAG: hypothetical protein DWQ21_11895 [Bacteroidetes bacterium]|nr:MAG: hypothetical protein DWQ21_11895 [Bacteroidota bacterium]REK54447.1 MAG: hypothetical protein DWQ49_11125 [Bacteroidota bacterium]
MMKTLKATTLLVFLLVASNVFGQLKVVRFGMKGGVNLPQQTLSLNDINSIVNDQTYDISNIQTEFSDGFNIGMITRVSLPLIPVYVHGEALYTQFDETIAITDGGTDFTINSTVQRLDFPISAGAKVGPAFAGLGATPSIPFANRSDLWTPDVDANFTWGWHIHAGIKLWRILGEVKYESGFGMLAGNVNYNYNDTDYQFELDQRRAQLVVSLAYFFQ